MKKSRIAIALILTFVFTFIAVSLVSGPAFADQGRNLEVSKRPYADVKVILYGTDW